MCIIEAERGGKRKSSGDNERWSELPDDVLVAILGRLPLRSAIATGILSRRWRGLWTKIPNIDLLYYVDFVKCRGDFFGIVDKLLPKFSSPIVSRFCVNLSVVHLEEERTDKKDKYWIAGKWFDWVCRQKKQVHEISLLMEHNEVFAYEAAPELPLSVFQTASLIVLQLKPWRCLHHNYDGDNVRFHLPNLKVFSTELFAYNSSVLDKLISSSPSLEDLSIQAYFYGTITHPEIYKYNVTSRSVKRLTLNFDYRTQVVIAAPNLVYLELHSISSSAINCLVSFANPAPSALLGCTISTDFCSSLENMLLPSNLYGVISTSVTSLTIDAKQLSPSIAEATYSRLTHLKFTSRLEGLALLGQCPTLEVLTVDLTDLFFDLCDTSKSWQLPDSTPQCILSCVKRIHILIRSVVRGLEHPLLHLLNYLLSNARVLELLRISITFKDERFTQLYNKLLQLPRPSAHCLVDFVLIPAALDEF